MGPNQSIEINICGTSHQAGYFVVLRETIGKRMAAKLKEIKVDLAAAHARVRRGHPEVATVCGEGDFQHHAVPGNEQRLRAFREDVLRFWLHQLRRRSQRSRWTWKSFVERLAVHIPYAGIEHPYPNVRFDAKHPR